MNVESPSCVILVHIEFPDSSANYQDDLIEFHELVNSTGAKTKALITGKRQNPSAKYFIGTGKADEVRQAVVLHQAELVVFNHDLSPAQERNLEGLLECRVLGRTGLILDIFAQRARSFEGRLQVELAQLQHLSTRLVRGWSHLERQKGGIGLRGPGETQLEVDRRLVRGRIKLINKRLEKVRSQREQGRRSRQRAELPTISLVGYTNAGKSTLFNALTTANVYVQDQLFATLDPTLRRIELPEIGAAILIDTVGFIRHLPHDLVSAFRSTLEETLAADLLLHVIDANDPERNEKSAAVEEVLHEIGAEKIPQLLVYNKIDLSADTAARVDYDAENRPIRVMLSAASGAGIDLLLDSLQLLLTDEIKSYELQLSATQGKLRAELYRLGSVVTDNPNDAGGWDVTVRLRERDFKRLRLDS